MGRKAKPPSPLDDPRVVAALQALGRIGGQTRARNLTAERRRAISKQGAAARWKKKPT